MDEKKINTHGTKHIKKPKGDISEEPAIKKLKKMIQDGKLDPDRLTGYLKDEMEKEAGINLAGKWWDEPNAEGWWWVIDTTGNYHPKGSLVVVYVYKNEDYDPDYRDPGTGEPSTPFSVYVKDDFTHYMEDGRETSVAGKWYGPIEPPIDGANVRPFKGGI